MTSSASSDNGSGTIDHTLGEKSSSSLQPIWEYDWKTESVRRMPRAPLLIAWYGIVFAAGCYPIVLSILVFAYWRPDLGFSTYAEMIIAVLCGLVIWFSLAMIYGIVMSIPAYLMLKFFGWILKAPVSSRAASGIYGGLTGFMCLTGGGLFLAITELPSGDDLEGLYFLIFTVVLAVVVGHLGAVWAGYRYRNQGFPFFDSIIPTNQKITIGFLMKLTAVVAVAATMCKAIGLAGLYVGIIWMAYFAVQLILLYCDHLFTRWLGWRRLRGDKKS